MKQRSLGRLAPRRVLGRFVSLLLLASPAAFACTVSPEGLGRAQTFQVSVTLVNGADPPPADVPLPANTGDREDIWDAKIQAVGANGKPISFNGVVRVTMEPGAVIAVENLATGETQGRNILLQDGKASARITATAMYGRARLWVEDLGYQPAAPGTVPECSNGKNDDPDEDPFIDFPSDPGCAFADDDSEEGGSFNAGVSAEVNYALPTVRDIQGAGSTTPYPNEAIQVSTGDPQFLVVTRIAKDGFYVTDLEPNAVAGGYNHLFAFNFSTPVGMRVCDRVTFLAGTVSEFFGFTELSFPSYRVDPLFEGQEANCLVPEPTVLDAATIINPVSMEKLESGLARIAPIQDTMTMPPPPPSYWTITSKFGPKLAIGNIFGPDQSNCDLNGDGRVDFESPTEASCGDACTRDRDCSEWTAFISRGNYKVYNGGSVMMVNTDSAAEFNAVAARGKRVKTVSGSLRNFSGGSLNWTLESRCSDDVVCCDPALDVGCCDPDPADPEALPRCAQDGCSTEAKTSQQACVKLRTEDDNDEGSN